jgi:ABC-type Fe3+/spermidine/putrescine transport system ATPase subunit
VTHNQEEAFDFADRIAVMEDGKILQTGTPEELYNSPKSLKVASFFGHCQVVDGEADGLEAKCSIGHLKLFKEKFGPVKILMRPENIRINLSDNADFIVKEVRFLGARKELTIQLPQTEIYANVSARSKIKKDDHVMITQIEPCPAF